MLTKNDAWPTILLTMNADNASVADKNAGDGNQC
jgi:hypothetical protein